MLFEKAECSLIASASASGLGARLATNPLGILVLASALIAGCSSTKSSVVERDRCLDAGPLNSVGYNQCVADREIKKQEALEALLDNKPAYPRQQQAIKSPDDEYQPSDFPDTPLPMVYEGVDAISVAEKRALPFKARIVWKYASTSVKPERRDAVRMDEMQRLIVSAVQDKGLAKWICTVTGGQQREWIFYTQSDEVFIAKARAALLKSGPYPVELSVQRDAVSGAEAQRAQTLAEDIRITPKICME